MSEDQQDLQRRERVFRILDDLKEKGERINADKVARIGRMGKQTVLPYYNEWRFLGDLDQQQQIELPDDLVRVLKRGIASWKHELSAQSRDFEEHANQEIDQLKQTLQQLMEKNEALENQLKTAQDDCQQCQSSISKLSAEAQEKDQQVAALKAELSVEKNQNTHWQKALASQQEDHRCALESMEKQLDHRYQEQLNHWIGVVDDERRQKQNLEKSSLRLNEKMEQTQKENNELQNRLENKTRAHLEACEDRNQFRDLYEQAKAGITILGKLAILLDCEETTLITSVRELQTSASSAALTRQQLNISEKNISELESKLKQAENKALTLSKVELELERARGMAEALEKALPTTQTHHQKGAGTHK